MNTPDPVHHFVSQLLAKDSSLAVQLDPPLDQSGEWWIDVKFANEVI